MKKLIALKPHYYGRELKVDDKYEADDEHARYLVLLGQAISDPAAHVFEDSPKSKRQYQRRDMEAEK
jgi:hypothetical protein